MKTKTIPHYIYISSIHILQKTHSTYTTATSRWTLARGKGKAIPVQAYFGPWAFQEVKAPRFQDSRHMKVVRLSAVRTGCFYPPDIFLVPFLSKAESTTLRPEQLCQWKFTSIKNYIQNSPNIETVFIARIIQQHKYNIWLACKLFGVEHGGTYNKH